MYFKNTVKGDPRSQHHASCSAYFNDEVMAFIENGPESAIFNTFGYKCCATERYGGIITEPLIKGTSLLTSTPPMTTLIGNMTNINPMVVGFLIIAVLYAGFNVMIFSKKSTMFKRSKMQHNSKERMISTRHLDDNGIGTAEEKEKELMPILEGIKSNDMT